jgi:DNA-binding response OmpR family regulator
MSEREIRKKIMVIDDDQTLLRELHRLLIMNEYEVVTVERAQEVVDAVHRTKPDVILLNLNMPNRSGFQIACDLNFFTRMVKVPIIAMSGFLYEKYRAVLRGYGITDYLRKPFEPLQLIMKIESLV